MFSARNAKVRLGIAQGVFVGTQWNVRDRNAQIDTTSFEDGGFANRMSSIWDVTVTVQGFWNQALNPHNPPSNIYGGSTIQQLRLYLDQVNDATLFWHFNYFYVEECETDSVVRDGMKFKFTGYNKGSFLRPGELVARSQPTPATEDKPN